MDRFLFDENIGDVVFNLDPDDPDENVFVMELDKSERGLGLGLIDGLVS